MTLLPDVRRLRMLVHASTAVAGLTVAMALAYLLGWVGVEQSLLTSLAGLCVVMPLGLWGRIIGNRLQEAQKADLKRLHADLTEAVARATKLNIEYGERQRVAAEAKNNPRSGK